MNKALRIVPGSLAAAVLSLFLASSAVLPDPGQAAQEPPQDVQKPSYDYMSTMFRSTSPLGLREDPAVRRMLGQGSVPWAIRAGSRHILD